MLTRRLASATSSDVAEQRLTLLVPLGATEQHGPHLPLDTDTRIAMAVAEGVAEARPDTVVAPAIAIGASGEHHGFAGTLSIGTRVLADLLVEIVRTAGPEFVRIVVINGHGGNAYALRAAAKTCAAEGRLLGVWSVRLPGADAHAGRTETSLLLHLAPELVRLDRAAPGNREPLDDLLPRLVEGGVRSVSASGVLGDPSGASALEGEALLATLVASALTAVGEVRLPNQDRDEPQD